MRLFLSAGEPSGDLHGANLTRALYDRFAGCEVVGFGGERMAQAGCRLLYPLCDLAVVGIVPALVNLPTFARVLGLAREAFRRDRPDALVLIDYPGFHWWLARCARQAGVPVVYFVPPQMWAWAGWRAGKMRRLVDQTLCTLPFEEPWFRGRGVPARFIGHPYFDALAQERLDAAFLAEQRGRPGPVVGILPGSRRSELANNLPSLARAAELIHTRRPDVRFLVACLKAEQADAVRARLAGLRLPIEVHHGRTPEIIHLSHSCLAVSGSVSLELLYRARPAAVLYRIAWHLYALYPLVRAKYITLVNLLADKLLFPEYVGPGCPAERLASHVLEWLQDRDAYAGLCGELAELRDRVARPGACGRAAEAIGELLERRRREAA